MSAVRVLILLFWFISQILWWAGVVFLARDRILRAWWPRFGWLYPTGIILGLGSSVLFLVSAPSEGIQPYLALLLIIGGITIFLHIVFLPDVFRGLPIESFVIVVPTQGQPDALREARASMDRHGWRLSMVNRLQEGRSVWLYDKDYYPSLRLLGAHPSRWGPRQIDIPMITILDGLVKEREILLRCYVFPPVMRSGKIRKMTRDYIKRATNQVMEILAPFEGSAERGTRPLE